MADSILNSFAKVNKDGTLTFNATRSQIGEILTSLGITSQAQIDSMSAGLMTTFGNLKTNSGTAFQEMKNKVVSELNDAGVKGNQTTGLFVSELISKYNTAKAQGGDAVAKLKDSVAADLETMQIVGGDKAKTLANDLVNSLNDGSGKGSVAISGLKASATGDLQQLATDAKTYIDEAGRNLSTGLHGTISVPRLRPRKEGIAGVAEAMLTSFSVIKELHEFGKGGIVAHPTIGLLAEKEPEAVIPLSRLEPVGAGETNITMNVALNSVSPEYDADKLADILSHKIARSANHASRVMRGRW
jgi:hypothetical protein